MQHIRQLIDLFKSGGKSAQVSSDKQQYAWFENLSSDKQQYAWF
jgi:hypothetical protein